MAAAIGPIGVISTLPPISGRARASSLSWRKVSTGLVAALAVVSGEMSFIDHLEELRKRLLWAVGFVILTFAVCWLYSANLYELASAPIRANPAVTLAIVRPQDIFSLYVKVTLVASLFASAPFVLTQAWMFISPGLHAHERRYAIPFVLSASILFLAGGAFGYFIAFPMALRTLVEMTLAAHLTPMINALDYFDLFFSIMVALGFVFQIPAVVFVLARIGLIDARFLIKYLRHAVFGCVLVAAVATPSVDIGSMMVIAVPMLALYGLGILIAAVLGRRRRIEPTPA